jgi:hypothetical protein
MHYRLQVAHYLSMQRSTNISYVGEIRLYAYVDYNNGKACVVTASFFSHENSEFSKNAPGISANSVVDFAFPAFVYPHLKAKRTYCVSLSAHVLSHQNLPLLLLERDLKLQIYFSVQSYVTFCSCSAPLQFPHNYHLLHTRMCL